MPKTKKASSASPFKDELTSRRHRLMMWGRLPAFLLGGGAMYLADPFWPGMVVLGLWYAIWLIWVAGVFEH
ncbi:hypothetical protein [Brevundimonas sp.]|uniref:hypothetical protein n=1 Tax=Brevundimonas sp. TaxID=1871086 RepID=UPI002D4835E9|nr:hypothetical protein [Brevundimonas sp.]HYC68830.1 hypothetical protein [Brevundimonas sp.]